SIEAVADVELSRLVQRGRPDGIADSDGAAGEPIDPDHDDADYECDDLCAGVYFSAGAATDPRYRAFCVLCEAARRDYVYRAAYVYHLPGGRFDTGLERDSADGGAGAAYQVRRRGVCAVFA